MSADKRIKAKPSDGFRSQFEKKVARSLKRRKVSFGYENVSLKYTLPERTYTSDFQLLDNGILIETKGYFSPSDRAKMRAVVACNPDVDIRIVFQNGDNLLKRGSKMRYGEWVDKYLGIPWATEDIPNSWIKEKKKKK